MPGSRKKRGLAQKGEKGTRAITHRVAAFVFSPPRNLFIKSAALINSVKFRAIN